MQDYSISKCTRKCAIGGRGLEPGENYYAVILPDGEESMSRIDIAAANWSGPQAEAIGWWKAKMPEAATKKTRPAPTGVLLDTLSDLLERPGQEPLAYLLALLLMRRRVLQEETQIDASAGQTSPSTADETPTHWNLVCPADGRQWNVPLCVPPAELMDELQQELKGLLFIDE